MASGHFRGLPIFHDDMDFYDRNQRSFRDLQSRLDDEFGRSGFGRTFETRNPWDWEDDLDRMCTGFHKLKPGRVTDLNRREEFGSRDSLDGGPPKSSYIEHPQTKSRTFLMSFDVKDYNPNDINVKADGDNLVISARHEDEVNGHTNVREFSRKIKIPSDVDIEKLSSTLSQDGILTIQAPVPPKYTSVAYVNPTVPATSNGQDSFRQVLNQSRSSPAPPHYQYTPPPARVEPVAPPKPSTPTPPPPPPPQQPKHQEKYEQTTQPVLSSPPPLFDPPVVPNMPVDTPVFRDSEDGKGREFELALEVPRPFTPEDVVVKLEGLSLKVEATHVEKSHGKSSSSSMSRSFDLTEDLDPGSVDAMLRSDGCLLIKGKVKQSK